MDMHVYKIDTFKCISRLDRWIDRQTDRYTDRYMFAWGLEITCYMHIST